MSYDSRIDTYEHIANVRGKLIGIAVHLLGRAHQHDLSKLTGVECEMFDHFTPKLNAMEYGTDEYRQCLADMQATGGLQHHYAANDHHPEHFPGGVADMDLIQVTEMLIDWKAASERMADGGDIERSIKVNAERFGYGPEIERLLLNTARSLRWIE